MASPTSGNVVLYALLGAAALASGGGAGPGSPFASSGGPGPQTLSLSPGDARWVEACGPDPAAACPVLIGVLATTQSAAFAVVARAAAYAQLASGVPAADSAPAGGGVALFRFFVGAAAAGQPVVVSVAVTAGDAALCGVTAERVARVLCFGDVPPISSAPHDLEPAVQELLNFDL